MFTRIAAAVAAIALTSAAANASLTLDLQTLTGGKVVNATPGQVVTLKVVATVTAGGAAADGYQSSYFSLLSTGSLLGNFSNVQAGSAFTGSAHQDSNAGANGGTTINPVDLDGDTDLDFGSNVNTSGAGFVFTRANSMQPGNVFEIATVDWTVGAIGTNANLNVRVRTGATGSGWSEDGVGRNGSTGTLLVGSPVAVSSGAVPEPATLGLLAPLAGALLARRNRKA